MPVGETHTDTQRYENLEQMIELVDNLVFGLSEVATCADRHEASMAKAGQKARRFLTTLRQSLED